MRRFDTLLHTRLYARLCGLAVALLLTFALPLVLTLAVAGSAYGEESVQAKHAATIQKILDDNAGNPDRVKDSIKKIFGDVQGNDAVLRTEQILVALPFDLSVTDWATIRAALEEKAMQLGPGRANASINRRLDEMDMRVSNFAMAEVIEPLEDEPLIKKPDRQYSSPMPPPPQTEVVCVSENC
jgi:hypothetical protein